MSDPFNSRKPVPVAIRQLLSKVILAVSDQLGIDVEADYEQILGCVFIRVQGGSRYIMALDSAQNIVIRGTYHEKSNGNINIKGLDPEDLRDNKIIPLNIVVGLRNAPYNEKLDPKLLRHEMANDRLAISKYIAAFDENCTFRRIVRCGKAMTNIWVYVGEYPISQFGAYLKEVDKKVFIRGVSKQDCINKLTALGVNPNQDGMDKLRRYNIDFYNWLEMFEIELSSFSVEKLLENDQDELTKFEEQVEFFVKLMILIDYIYQH